MLTVKGDCQKGKKIDSVSSSPCQREHKVDQKVQLEEHVLFAWCISAVFQCVYNIDYMATVTVKFHYTRYWV